MEFDALNGKLRSLTDLFPTFESEVANVQRRTVRRWTLEYIKRLSDDVTTELSHLQSEDNAKVWGELLEKGLTALTGKDVPSKEKKVETGVWVKLTPEGELSVTRRPFFSGIVMSAEEFHSCVDAIRNRVNEDAIDVSTSPEVLVKNYLVEFCKERREKLPVFRKGRLVND